MRGGMFKDSLIWGDCDLQFVTAGSQHFYIPIRIVLDDKYEAMFISNSWLFENYSHNTDDALVLALECTESKTPVVPHMKRCISEPTHANCPDFWLQRHVIIYEDINNGN